MDMAQQLRLWADELRSIADEELVFNGNNPYAVARGTRLRRVAAEVFAAQDARDGNVIERIYRGSPSHISPHVGGDAGVVDKRGQILLVQRADDHLWAMPGGLLEVSETAAEGVRRETWEETGVQVETQALVGVYDSRRCGSRMNWHLYHFVFLCRAVDARAEPRVSHESIGAAWFKDDALPPLSPGHAVRIADVFRFWRGELRNAVFDA